MSNQFYDYLSDKLISFFNENSLNPGDRFFINLDNIEQVENFYAALNKKATDTFEYRHDDDFGIFKTFMIKFENVELIVATSEVKSDFLVTLRNEVSKLKGIWENKALLIISEDVKDSINEGMVNLQEEGYPLSLSYISNNLADDINKSDLSPVHRDVLNVFLENNAEKALYKSTLWDFEEVLSIINKETIDFEDYKGLDMFYDSGLETISNSASRKNRIKDNRKLFLEIDDVANFDEFESKIEKTFDKKGINELTDDENWTQADYKVLLTSMEDYAKKTGKIRYVDSKVKNNLLYWEKPEKDTVAGRRKRHIIIFNNENLDEISITFSFDKELNRSFLKKSSKEDASISKKNLIFKFKCNSDAPTFRRYVYEHEHLTKNNFTFNICVLNIDDDSLSSIKTIYNVNSRNKKILINQDQGYLLLGKGEASEVVISENNNDFNISEGNAININIDDSLLQEDAVEFNLIDKGLIIPFMIKKLNPKTPPIKSIQVWDKKRINQLDFILEDSKLIQGDNGYNIATDNFKVILNIEKEMVENKIIFGMYDKDQLIPGDIVIPDTIKNSYMEIFNYYSLKNNIPSLVYLDDELKRLYKRLLYYFNQEIENISENHSLATSNKKDLLKVGVIEYGDKLLFSSLSPLNIAYQLEVYNQCGSEEIDFNILDSLVPNNLLPYLYMVGDDKLYRPIYQDVANAIKEWIIYEESDEVSIGTTNVFIKKVVTEKLKQFVSHFKYLFNDNSKAPIKINIINVDNDIEVVKGVFEFIRDRLPDKRKTGGVIPVEVHIYNKNNETAFNTLFKCKNEDEFQQFFDMDLDSTGIDSLDILRLVQENISYYYDNLDNVEFEYAHISFYKALSSSRNSSSAMNEIETGMSLNGLMSVATSNPPESENIANHKNYRTGFGIKHADLSHELSIFAKNINEFALNNRNDGYDPYRKDFSIVSMPDMVNEDLMEDLFEKSHWVTFIEPNFGLDYFSDNSNLFIIHYSDQYSSSAKYDTITVTNKSNQYKQIIREFLENSNLDDMNFTDLNIEEVIRIFNTINGEWLLHIGLNDNTEKEKLSVVSAIKYVLSIFDHKDIVWVPISMEEILRVAGNIGLKETNGLFSVKNLIGTREGKYSDDLLLMGLNIQNSEIYYYPVEVKLGGNPSNVIKKAKSQINGTSKLFKEYLNEGNTFKNKFYRNFFIQLFISNAKKLLDNGIWDDKDFSIIDAFKKDLLNDNYIISSKLESEIGIGSIISFKKEVPSHSVDFEDGIYVVELPDSDGYYGIINSIEHIHNLIHGGNTNISQEKLLFNRDLNSLEEPEHVDEEGINLEHESPVEEPIDSESKPSNVNKPKDFVSFSPVVNQTVSIENISTMGTPGKFVFGSEGEVISVPKVPNDIPESLDIDNPIGSGVDDPIGSEVEGSGVDDHIDSESGQNVVEPKGEDNITGLKQISDIRALIGTRHGTDQKVYWEYGNEDLGNKHMLIQGKSGQGKTYFIQRVLKELSNQDIPSIIIDYTDGFRFDQLEEEFKDELGDNLKQYIVMKNKFPLNPFKRYLIDLGDGEPFMQDESEVASRFKSIISSVFPSLGNQQLNVLYQSVISGLHKYGENMDLYYLKTELENDGSGPAISLLNNLRGLLDKNPFDINSDFDWSDLDKRNGNVIIIQLTALQSDIQKIISELILWDLWSYKTQNGSKDKPFVIVLDEAHNLDFGSNSPCGKILQEGRKFGWSAIFATQAVKNLFKSDEIAKLDNVEEKIFFHPTDSSTKSIADTISYDQKSKKEWENKLLRLNKGQCVVYAQLRKDDGSLDKLKPYHVDVASLDK